MRRSFRSLRAAAAMCLVVAACGAAPGASPSMPPSASPPIASVEPSATPASTPSQSVEPSASVPGDSVPFPPDAYARVVTDDLRVRSMPGVSDDSKKLGPLLQDGVVVFVLDGPVQASGYDWYLVQPNVMRDDEEEYPFGWVAAAGKDGEPWIQTDVVKCPPLPVDLDDLEAVTQLDRASYEIGCYSGRKITLRGRLGRPPVDCGDPQSIFEPSWFSQCPSNNAFLAPANGSVDPEPAVYPIFEPEVDLGLVPDPEFVAGELAARRGHGSLRPPRRTDMPPSCQP